MPTLASTLDTHGADCTDNRDCQLALIDQLRSLEARTRQASALSRKAFDKRG